MKRNTALLLAAAMLTSFSVTAQTIFDEGDTDIGIGYVIGDGWDLHIHQEEPPPGIEVEPADGLLRVNGSAQTTVPAGASWSFLGSAGSPVWILPQNNTAGLLYLGWATEEITDGIFVNDEVTLTLKSVSGPGDFSVFSTTVFGPTVRMNSGDGITALDRLILPTGTHEHYNVGFTAPGDYTVAFEASGTLVDGNLFTASGDVEYFFTVVPEPTSAALIGVGMAALLLARRRQASTSR
jgi:surface-anchored protein